MELLVFETLMFERQFPILQCDLLPIRKYAGVAHILNAVHKAVSFTVFYTSLEKPSQYWPHACSG